MSAYDQGLSARVVGDHLDNAFGDEITEMDIVCGYQEFVVILERDENFQRGQQANK